MKNQLRRFVSDEQGLESVEYAVLGGLILVGIIGAVVALGGNITAIFNKLVDATAEPPAA